MAWCPSVSWKFPFFATAAFAKTCRARKFATTTTTAATNVTSKGKLSPPSPTSSSAPATPPGGSTASIAEVINKWLYSQIAGWSGVPSQKLSKEFSATWIKAHVYIAGEAYTNKSVQLWMMGTTCLIHGTQSRDDVQSLSRAFRKEAPTSINRRELMASLTRLSRDSLAKGVNFPACLLYSSVAAMASEGLYGTRCVSRVAEVAAAMQVRGEFLKKVEGVAKADCNVRRLRINLIHPTGPPY